MWENQSISKRRLFVCSSNDEGVMVPPGALAAVVGKTINVEWSCNHNPILTTWKKAMYYYGQDKLYENWTFIGVQSIVYQNK